jgi:hypothetical protein
MIEKLEVRLFRIAEISDLIVNNFRYRWNEKG